MTHEDLEARVAATAEAMEARGTRATSARVRQELGMSANRVHPAFKSWREKRDARRRAALEPAPATVDVPVPPALREAMQVLLAAHARSVAQEIERERTAADVIRAGLAAQLEAARTLAGDAAAEAETESAALAEAEGRIEAFTSERADLVATQEDLRGQLAGLSIRVEKAEAQVATAERRAADERAARADAEGRLDVVREDLGRAREALEKLLAAYRRRKAAPVSRRSP